MWIYFKILGLPCHNIESGMLILIIAQTTEAVIKKSFRDSWTSIIAPTSMCFWTLYSLRIRCTYSKILFCTNLVIIVFPLPFIAMMRHIHDLDYTMTIFNKMNIKQLFYDFIKHGDGNMRISWRIDRLTNFKALVIPRYSYQLSIMLA